MKLFRRILIVCLIGLAAACDTNRPNPIATRGPLPTVTPLPWRAATQPISAANADHLARIGSLTEHTATVNRISFSHSGGAMLSLDGNGKLIVWDFGTGKARFVLSRAGAILNAFFTPEDSQVITVGADNKISVWNATDGSQISSIPSEVSGTTQASAPTDGSLLAIGHNDGLIAFYKPPTAHAPVYSVLGQQGPLIRALAFAPDGKQFASIATDDVVRVWDAADGKSKATIKDFGKPPLQLIFSVDGSRLAVAAGAEVDVFSGADFKTKQVFTEPDLAGQRGMAFSPDGKFLAVGSTGQYVYVWNLSDSRQAARLPGHDNEFSSLMWSPDGGLLLTTATSLQSGAFVWNASTFKPENQSYSRGQVSASNEAIYLALWSPDGKRIVTADARGFMTVWGIPGP